MPQFQTVDLSPIPRTQRTPLEMTLDSFSQRHRENINDQQDTDALRDIYGKYQRDGRNLEDALMAIQTRPGISPTTRVNSANQLLQMQKYNNERTKQAQANVEKAEKKAQNQEILKDIETRRGLEPGSLAAYADNPAMAAQVTKQDKGTQASQPINEDQLRRIQHVESRPEFAKASIPEKSKMLRDAGVSKENSGSVLNPYIEEAKIDNERGKTLTKKTAENDVDFYKQQVEAVPRLLRTQDTINAANVLNEEGVTGKLWDQAMQTAGLLQFTNEGFRQFASYAKEMVKNQNIRSIVGSQISQMEFGFFRDATISERFSKEANRQILRKEQAALRYEKLYADITKSLVEQNGGVIPERLQEKVNEEFARQSPKISKEIKEAAADFEAIQNVPKGKVLMYDKKRRPLHVPANEVEKYSKPPYGATLS